MKHWTNENVGASCDRAQEWLPPLPIFPPPTEIGPDSRLQSSDSIQNPAEEATRYSRLAPCPICANSRGRNYMNQAFIDSLRNYRNVGAVGCLLVYPHCSCPTAVANSMPVSSGAQSPLGYTRMRPTDKYVPLDPGSPIQKIPGRSTPPPADPTNSASRDGENALAEVAKTECQQDGSEKNRTEELRESVQKLLPPLVPAVVRVAGSRKCSAHSDSSPIVDWSRRNTTTTPIRRTISASADYRARSRSGPATIPEEQQQEAKYERLRRPATCPCERPHSVTVCADSHAASAFRRSSVDDLTLSNGFAQDGATLGEEKQMGSTPFSRGLLRSSSKRARKFVKNLWRRASHKEENRRKDDDDAQNSSTPMPLPTSVPSPDLDLDVVRRYASCNYL